MSFAVMPLSDYKAACDKVREKVDLTTVKFEETDFGFLRSEVFTVPQDSVYIFSYEFSDPSKFPDLYYSSPEWEGETSPGYFEPIDSNSAETASKLYAGVQYRIFIADSLGLTPKDILKASLLLAEEIVVDFVPPPKIKSGEFADKVEEVYEAGRKDGYEAGQKAEYDRFWDGYQQNGNRTQYDNAFAQWNSTTFKPKYDIKAKSLGGGFWNTDFSRKSVADILDEQGVKLDTSNCTYVPQLFQNAKTARIPELNLTNATTMGWLLYNCNAVKVDKIISSETTNFSGTDFVALSKCTDITFEGVVAKSLDFSYSPLSVGSMKSIISCLKNYAGTGNENTYKVTFTSACWTALEASGTSPSGGTWKDYVFNDLGWNY